MIRMIAEHIFNTGISLRFNGQYGRKYEVAKLGGYPSLRKSVTINGVENNRLHQYESNFRSCNRKKEQPFTEEQAPLTAVCLNKG